MTPNLPNSSPEYMGFMSNDHSTTQRVFGVFRITPTELCFTSDQINNEIRFSLKKIFVSLGGMNNSQLFFTHPDFPEIRLFTSDFSLLKNQYFLEYDALAYFAKKSLQHKKIKLCTTWGIVFFISIFILFLFFLPYFFAPTMTQVVPTAMDIQIGKLSVNTLSFTQQEILNQEALKELKKLTTPIFEKYQSTHFDFSIHILESDEINAFALAGGPIFIHKALILNAKTPGQLAGVIAHEVAHIEQRHHIQQIISSLGYSIILNYILADLSNLTNLIITYNTVFGGLAFSREHEREADQCAIEVLKKLKINPSEMADFFAIMQQQSMLPSEIEKHTAFISSHPSLTERITTIRTQHQDFNKHLNYSEFSDFNLTKLQQLLQETK